MWELDCEEGWAPKNWCFWSVVLEKTLVSPLDCKEIQAVHSEGDQPWDFFGGNDSEAETPALLATSCEELTNWKRLWCWEGLGTGGEGDDRGWDGWLASLTRWTWVWVNSGCWWWTGRPGVLRFMGSQRVGHDWADWTELNWMWSGRGCPWCLNIWLCPQHVGVWVQSWFPRLALSDKMTLNTGPEGGIQDMIRTQDDRGEGNGNPLQYSCLVNPMDWGAW